MSGTRIDGITFEENSKIISNKKEIYLRECNNNCLFCFHRDMSKIIDYTDSIERFRKDIDSAKKLNENLVVEFAGAECTINKNFPDMVRYLKTKNIPFVLVTNARALSVESYLDFLVRNGLSIIATSFHSFDEENHEKITQAKGSYGQVKEGIMNCVKHNVPITVNTVICSINELDIYETEKMLINDLKVNNTKISGLRDFKAFPGWEIKDLVSDYALAKEQIGKSIELFKKNNNNVLFENLPLCILKKDDMYKNSVHKSAVEGFVKPDFCDNCMKKESCPGIFPKNLEIFGTSGLERFE